MLGNSCIEDIPVHKLYHCYQMPQTLKKWNKLIWRLRILALVLKQIFSLWGSVQFSSVQLLRCCWLFVTPWTTAHQASLSITNSWSPPKPMSTESVMPSNHLILCHPLLLLPSIFPSIRVLSNESALLIRWPKYWSFSFSISPSNEHPGLLSFWMDWLDLLAGQGTLKSLLQHHSSKASILRRSVFLIDQLSHPYMTTGKTIALTRRTFVGKVMSLPFNMLSRLVITFLPRSKRLFISWLQSLSGSDLGAQKNKVSHWFHCFPIYLPWSDGGAINWLQFHRPTFLNSLICEANQRPAEFPALTKSRNEMDNVGHSGKADGASV